MYRVVRIIKKSILQFKNPMVFQHKCLLIAKQLNKQKIVMRKTCKQNLENL